LEAAKKNYSVCVVDSIEIQEEVRTCLECNWVLIVLMHCFFFLLQGMWFQKGANWLVHFGKFTMTLLSMKIPNNSTHGAIKRYVYIN
jgi:hypothetical protein